MIIAMYLSEDIYSVRRLRSLKGFTLVEILIALTIFGLVMAGAMAFLIQSLNTYYYDSAKLFVNRDIRTFTSEMSDNATYADHNFIIYKDFGTRTPMNSGQSGDFLVLYYKDQKYPPDPIPKINRIVGYYRDPTDSTGKGPVRKFDIAINPSSNADISTLLPSTGTLHTNSQVLQLSLGLADNCLFYNYKGTSIMVKGQIFHQIHGNQNAANTYNFTVSPRS